MFNCKSITVFRRNKNLKELIGSNKTKQKKKQSDKRQIQKLKAGKCCPCLTNLKSLSYKQVLKTTTLRRQRTKKVYKTFHIVNCASS